MRVIPLLLGAALALAGTSFAADALFVDAKVVAKAQKTLNDRGFRTGGVDGRMGPQTQAALVNFQRAEKLQPSGKLDRPTLVALGIQGRDGSAGSAGRTYDRTTIRKAQETLNARGFKAGAPNGVLGESTQTALRAFQKSEGLTVTGRLNPRTLAALGIDRDTASAGSTQRAEVADNATVREVQRKLAERGYRPGAPDGVLGRATRAALMEFQRAENLAVTGRPNRQTLAALGIGRS